MTDRIQRQKSPTFLRSGAEATLPFRGANIVDAGEHNKNLVLQAIRAHGPIPRAKIASLVYLTPPSVFKITNDLAASRLIVKAGKSSGALGKPATSWSINPEGAFSLGFNIDRDHLTLVLLDFAGNVRKAFHREMMFADPKTVRTFFADCGTKLKFQEPAVVDKLVGIGVSVPDDMGMTKLPNQPPGFIAWSDVRLETLLEGIFDLPICLENDAAAAAIGEMYFGGGLTSDTFFYILISAGLGGGLIVNRHYYRGAHGRSGEIGYLPQINPFKSRFSSLQKTLGDGVLLTDLYAMLRDAGIAAASLADLSGLNSVGQECVNQWIAKISDLLYLPLLGVLFGIDPDAVYVGGRLPKPILQRLCIELSKRVSLNVGPNWPQHAVRPAQLAEHASAIGAAVLAFKSFWNKSKSAASRRNLISNPN